MTKDQLINYVQGCIALAEEKPHDGLAYVRPDALRALIALIPADEPRDKRLLAALRTIRFAGYNDHPTSVWMQKVAAHAMEPEKWPEQPPDPPADEPRDEQDPCVSHLALRDIEAAMIEERKYATEMRRIGNHDGADIIDAVIDRLEDRPERTNDER